MISVLIAEKFIVVVLLNGVIGTGIGVYGKMKENIISILMRRDDMTREETIRIIEETRDEIACAIENGASLDEIEDILADYLMLEPDYLIEFLMQVI